MGKGLAVERLTALGVSRAKSPGLYPDGRGLYLQVAPGGARSWLLRYRFGDRRPEMGLGSLAVVGLAQARQKAMDARKLLDAGILTPSRRATTPRRPGRRQRHVP